METTHHRATIADLWRRLSRLKCKRRYLQWIEYKHDRCLWDGMRGGYECRCRQCMVRIKTTRQITEEADKLASLIRQTQIYIEAALNHPGLPIVANRRPGCDRPVR